MFLQNVIQKSKTTREKIRIQLEKIVRVCSMLPLFYLTFTEQMHNLLYRILLPVAIIKALVDYTSQNSSDFRVYHNECNGQITLKNIANKFFIIFLTRLAIKQ